MPDDKVKIVVEVDGKLVPVEVAKIKSSLAQIGPELQTSARTGSNALADMQAEFSRLRTEIDLVGQAGTLAAGVGGSAGIGALAGGFAALTPIIIAAVSQMDLWKSSSQKALEINMKQVDGLRVLGSSYGALKQAILQTDISLTTKGLKEQLDLLETAERFRKGQLTGAEAGLLSQIGAPAAAFLGIVPSEEELKKAPANIQELVKQFAELGKAAGIDDVELQKIAIRAGIAGESFKLLREELLRLSELPPGQSLDLLFPHAPVPTGATADPLDRFHLRGPLTPGRAGRTDNTFDRDLTDELRRQEQERTEIVRLQGQIRLDLAVDDFDKLKIQYQLDLERFKDSEQIKTLLTQKYEIDRQQLAQQHQQEVNDKAQREQEKLLRESQQRYKELWDNVRDNAGRAFDDIFLKAKGGLQGLVSFFETIWLTLMRKMFSDAVANLLSPFLSRFSGIFAPAAGGGSPGGAILGGLSPLAQGGTRGGLFSGGGIFNGSQGGGIFSLANAASPLTQGGIAGGSLTAGQLGALPTTIGFGNLAPLAGGATGIGVPASTAAGGFAATHGIAGLSFAQLGAFFSNPLTIAIAGATIGGLLLFKFLHNRQEKKFHDEILKSFGIDVQEMKVLQQIKKLGDQLFGGSANSRHADILGTDPVQGILLSYAQRSGQSPLLLPLYQRFYGHGGAATPVRLEQSGIQAFAGGGTVRKIGGVNRGFDDQLILAQAGETVLPRGVAPISISFGDIYANTKADAAEISREIIRQITIALRRDVGRTGFRDSLFGT